MIMFSGLSSVLNHNSEKWSAAIQNTYSPVTGGTNHPIIRLPRSVPSSRGLFISNKPPSRSVILGLTPEFIAIFILSTLKPLRLNHVSRVAPQVNWHPLRDSLHIYVAHRSSDARQSAVGFSHDLVNSLHSSSVHNNPSVQDRGAPNWRTPSSLHDSSPGELYSSWCE